MQYSLFYDGISTLNDITLLSSVNSLWKYKLVHNNILTYIPRGHMNKCTLLNNIMKVLLLLHNFAFKGVTRCCQQCSM